MYSILNFHEGMRYHSKYMSEWPWINVSSNNPITVSLLLPIVSTVYQSLDTLYLN